MVEELLCEFVPRELAAGLDFGRLQRVNPKFYANRRSARRREADVIWRVPTRGEKSTYWYLLIEFQRECDAYMAVRTQVYQGLLWQQVIDEQRLRAGAPLPPLLLLVLYNGERRWTAADTTSELITLSPDSWLWPWQPRVRYGLLDMGSFPKDELAQRSSLVALLFRLEQRHSLEELRDLLSDVMDWFRQHEGCERLQGLFTELIREAVARNRVNSLEAGNLSEVTSMFSIDWESAEKQWFANGHVKGKADGMAEALISLLSGRFGAVAPPRLEQIRGADLPTLAHWFNRAIDAPDLPSVFDPRC
jgi:hypothetical protein